MKKNKEVKVSICIPAYKNVRYIQRCIDSINEQTYKDIEIVITDDTEVDEIQQVIQRYKDQPIRYYKNKRTLGATGNNNAALALASGIYVKPMHHDDYFKYPDSLERMVKMLDEHPEADIAFSGTEEIYEDAEGNIDQSSSYCRAITDEQDKVLSKDIYSLFAGNVIGAPSAVLVRNRGILMDEKLTWMVDLEYYIRILKNSRYIYTRKPLVVIGNGPGKLTEMCMSDSELRCNESIYIYSKYDLGKTKAYRKSLVFRVIDAGGKYQNLRDTGISIGEYVFYYTRKKSRKIIPERFRRIFSRCFRLS